MDKLDVRQIELVEFGERVFHAGLRHTGINGGLYEDILISYLREDIPSLNFFKGQIKDDGKASPQYDILICKKETMQNDFLNGINSYVSAVESEKCLGVIELKKYAYPKMITKNGPIEIASKKFKENYPDLAYIFVCFRFKDRKQKVENNWHQLYNSFAVDSKFCFWGNVYNEDKEWEFPWIKNEKLIERNKKYFGEYKRLVEKIKSLSC